MSGAPIGRRGILGGGLALAACGRAPAFIRRDAARPLIPEGALAGDVGEDSALIWSRCDRQATMVVEWSAGSARGRVYGPSVGPASDFAGTTMLRDLPAGAAVEYRVRFLAEDGRTRSAPVEGLLRTAPVGGQPLRILWSGDTCGQGYGIDAARGGLQTYAAMLARAPDLFVHCGDLIYADNPIPATIKLADGTEWRNQTMAGREKVAETIDEFRAAYRYNLLDEHYARFHRTVATIFAWDDHEVLNNWYPGEILGDDEPRYQVREVDVLAARGRQAFREHTAIAGETIHRVIRYGPLCDLFVLDMRSFRGPNTAGLEEAPEGPTSAILGADQARWLADGLASSKALWKLVIADMPLGLVVADGAAIEAVANGDAGPPRGREHSSPASSPSSRRGASPTSSGSPPTSTTRRPTATTRRGRSSATSTPSGSSCRGRSTPAPSARARSTRPSAPSSASSRRRRRARPTCRRPPASSSSASSRSARAGS